MTKNATAPKNATSLTTLATTGFMSDLPPPDKAQHKDHHDEQHRQHEQRDGGAMGHVAGNDADLKTLKAQHRGCAHRTAHGHQKDDGKIGKRKHDTENQADGHDRQDYRHDDLVVAAPETGAVDRRRVDHVLRDRSDAGEEDYDREREETPGIDDNHAQNRQFRA